MGDPLVDPAGVPPLGVVVRSNTGPSYMPRGTACISAICHQREDDSDASLLPGSILPWQCQAAVILGSPVPPQRQFTLPPLCPSVLHAQDLPAALRPGTAPPPTSCVTASLHSCPAKCAEPGATGNPSAWVCAVWMEEKAILPSLLIFNSALPSRVLLQQDSNKGRHHPLLTQMSICLQW